MHCEALMSHANYNCCRAHHIILMESFDCIKCITRLANAMQLSAAMSRYNSSLSKINYVIMQLCIITQLCELNIAN